MTKPLLAVPVALATLLFVGACAPADQSATSCAAIAGNWSVRYSADPNDPGDCPGKLLVDTLTFAADGTMSSPEFGTGCGTKISGCQVSGSCVTKPAGGQWQLGVALTFSGRDVSGKISARVTSSTGESCTENLQVSGQRN